MRSVAFSVALAGLGHRRGRAAMCIVGVAAGVGLSCAVRVQTIGLGEGQQSTERALAGRASIEAVALGPRGMPVAAFRRVAQLPSVAAVAPVSVADVTIDGRGGAAGVRLVGVDRRLRAIGSPLGATIGGLRAARDLGVYLPAELARSLGLRRGDRIVVRGPAGRRESLVAGTPSTAGDTRLGAAAIALAPLGLAQSLTGQQGRIDRLLVRESAPGNVDRAALRRAIGPGTRLRAPGWESDLLAQASQLDRRSADLFAVLCLLLGGIVVYSVTLLAAADRRREVATLAALGCAPRLLGSVLLYEALVVGVVGGTAGVALGWGLVHALGAQEAGHLASAFTLSGALRLDVATAVGGVLGGVATAIVATLAAGAGLASAPPAAALSATGEEGSGSRRARPLRAAAVVALLAGGLVAALAPRAGPLAVCLVAAGAVLLVPSVLLLVLRAIGRVLPSPAGAGGLGVAEVRHQPRRAGAMAAIVAVMVLGIVTVGSSVANLEHGTDRLAQDSFAHADLWATAGDDVFLTRPIDTRAQAVMRAQPGVADVRPYRSAFLDWDDRRVLVYSLDASSPRFRFDTGTRLALPAARARRLLDRRAAVLISRELADALGVKPGGRVTLPTPSGPRTLEVAGLVPNYGWQPGAVALSGDAIRRWWGEPSLTALKIDLASASAGAGAVAAARRRLQPAAAAAGVRIELPSALRRHVRDTTRAGLAPLRRIAQLLSILGVLALTVSLVASIMQRGRRVATLHAIGMRRRDVLLSLTAESATITIAGALAGLAGGLLAHRFVVEYLTAVTAYPVGYAIQTPVLGLALGLAAASAVLVPLLSLRRLSQIPIQRSFSDVL